MSARHRAWLGPVIVVALLLTAGCTAPGNNLPGNASDDGTNPSTQEPPEENMDTKPPIALEPISGEEEYFEECGEEDLLAVTCPVFRVRLTNNADQSVTVAKEDWRYLDKDGGARTALHYKGPDAIAPGGSSVIEVGVEQHHGAVVYGLTFAWSNGEETVRVPHFGVSCEDRVCELRSHNMYLEASPNDLRWTAEGEQIGTGTSAEFTPPERTGHWTIELSLPAGDSRPTYQDVVQCDEDRGCYT